MCVCGLCVHVYIKCMHSFIKGLYVHVCMHVYVCVHIYYGLCVYPVCWVHAYVFCVLPETT